MSNNVFPGTLANMPGLGWTVTKVPTFQTKIQTSSSNIELRASFTPYPVWKWTLVYNFLRQGSPTTEFDTLAGFFLQRQGAFDSFLYDDPSDDSVTDQSLGVGDGSTTQFQLVRTFGGFSEPVYNVNTLTNVKVAGSVTAVTQSHGLITFGSAPANGAALTWTGTYRWRVRFADDSASFEEFAYLFWQAKSISLMSILGS